MNLATIVLVSLIGLGGPRVGWTPPAVRESPEYRFALRLTAWTSPTFQNQEAAAPPQASPTHNPQTAPPSSATPGQEQNSAAPAKPQAKPRPHKKTGTGNCTTTAQVVGGQADSKMAASSNGGAPAKPCPPPKKVVRNGGSEEPTVQLVGGTTAQPGSTDQLAAATEENLKKVAGRELTPSQQEMVSQIRQFLEQSKTAVSAGDAERGRKLAMKAHLLSDELVKP